LLGCVADFSNAPKLPKYYRDPRFSIGNLRDRVNQMLKLEEQIKCLNGLTQENNC